MHLMFIKESAIHDFELCDIIVHYSNSKIYMQLKDPRQINCEFTIHNFISFNIINKQEWGGGKHVAASDISRKTNGNYLIEIQLNSGDTINVEFEANDNQLDEVKF